VFKDENTHMRVLSRVASKVRDQHNRFGLFTPFTLMEYTKSQGPILGFSTMNPTGHYCLNLLNTNHRDFVRSLCFINK